MRVALLGGSFNPIHTDHVSMIEYCYDQLKFDEVWVIPNYHNPDKLTEELAPIHHRLAMIKITTHALKYVQTCRLELEPCTHLTYQTINRLVKKHPSIKFTFCLGQDLLTGLEKWDRFDQIKTKVAMICFRRKKPLNDQEKMILQRNHIKIYHFNNQNLCSTEIRRGEKLTRQIPSVNNYINEHHLYLKPRLQAAQVSKNRIAHCFQVAITAQNLAKKNQVNPRHAYLAGALHDITKNWTIEKQLSIIKQYGDKRILTYHPNLYHAWTGYLFLKHHLLIKNETVLTAVKHHTTGSDHDHHPLEKIIFIADKISSDRTYHNVERYRKLSKTNLNWCYYQLLKRIFTKIQKQKQLQYQDPLLLSFFFWSNKLRIKNNQSQDIAFTKITRLQANNF